MDDAFISTDYRAQYDSLPSSINSNNKRTTSLKSIRNSFKLVLSKEDMENCLYVININWHEKYFIHLSNDQHRRIYSIYSQENLSVDQINLSNYSSLKNSYRNHWGRSLSSIYLKKNLLSNSSLTYSQLKHFAEKLFHLERTVYEAVRQKIYNQQISSHQIPSLLTNYFRKRQSSIKNLEQLLSNVNKQPEINGTSSTYIPIICSSKNNSFTKIKLRRINSSPQSSLHQITPMSSVDLLSVGSRSSSPTMNSSLFKPRRHSITTTNLSDTNSQLDKSQEKQITFEVKTNIFNKNIEVKTKQEDTICITNQLSSPHRIQIHQPIKSSISNNRLQSVRVSVTSSPYENEVIQKIETESPICPSVLSNLVQKNLNEHIKSREEEDKKLDYRPLFALITKLNQTNLSNQSENLPNKTSSSSNILPAKQLTPFKPTILRKKFQEPSGCADLIHNIQQSSLLSPSVARRNGIIRSHTIPNPADINSNFTKISSNDVIICQSTPQLASSNQSIDSPNLTTQLSTSATSLTSTLNPNATPTSSGTIDDKNEWMSDKNRPTLIRASTLIIHNKPLNSTLSLYTKRRHHTEPQHESSSQQAKRKAIAMQMYDTEKSYVEALKNLVTKYYLPMKDKNIISNDLLNDIFYKIPEIHIHHTAFLISLSQNLSQWDNKQTVGDLLLQMFTRISVIETYTSFVNNYKTAQLAIHLCRDFSSFNKFLEQQARDHRGKLTLRDLIIQPVQRIPRYELYMKDFLKCTNINHPDYQLLLKAQLEIHSLAEQIDQVQKEAGSTDWTLTNNSLEIVQDIIENLTDLVHVDRYYICYDIVTLQSSTGIKKDRCIFLFNDLLIITSCKKRNQNLTKKTANSIVINSPSGKQYIDNTKHKLIMKIPLDNVDLAADHLKKSRSSLSTPPTLKKSHSTATTTLDKHRHFEEDVVILGQMSDLSKTITIPHQQLDDSIKEALNTVNKHLLDETTNSQKLSPEPNSISDNIQQKSPNIQLILNTTECLETIDVIFSSAEQKISWQKNFLEAKKVLFEIATGRRNITFQHVLILPHNRSESQFSCGAIRPCSNDLCLCNTDGEICLINIESDLTIKSSNTITSSVINCIAYVPSNRIRQKNNSIKHRNDQSKDDSLLTNQSNDIEISTPIDSLLDINSSDEDEMNSEENLSLNNSSIDTLADYLNNEQPNNTDATIWLGTENGGLFIYECSQTMKIVGRKSRIIKQFNCSIHSILYSDNKVFLALNHGQLAVFKRDLNGQWDLDSPIIRSLEENCEVSNNKNGELYDEENSDPISVMTLAAGKLWCAIRDRIFVVCTNSLNVQHSFIVDDCHRHVSSMATGGSSMHLVWIASQGSHEIRLYHATHFVCLLETSIRTAVTQKLQACDDIIRAHKLGCLHVNTLHVCKETLWIGTSAGVVIHLIIPQLIDSSPISSSNKLTSNSVQLKGLPFGHVGPVRFIISTDQNILSTTDETSIIKTFVITIGDGFEDYNHNDETLGKDDALSHLILWEL